MTLPMEYVWRKIERDQSLLFEMEWRMTLRPKGEREPILTKDKQSIKHETEYDIANILYVVLQQDSVGLWGILPKIEEACEAAAEDLFFRLDLLFKATEDMMVSDPEKWVAPGGCQCCPGSVLPMGVAEFTDEYTMKTFTKEIKKHNVIFEMKWEALLRPKLPLIYRKKRSESVEEGTAKMLRWQAIVAALLCRTDNVLWDISHSADSLCDTVGRDWFEKFWHIIDETVAIMEIQRGELIKEHREAMKFQEEDEQQQQHPTDADETSTQEGESEEASPSGEKIENE